jgi:5'-nucleotidase
MTTRRGFWGTLLRASLGIVSALGTALALSAAALPSFDQPTVSDGLLFDSNLGDTLVTILHTNDMHSQIDPLPANDKYAGKGGVARRATLVKRIRSENPNTLLVDAGDAFQGTPYFNLYRGEVEYKAMSAIGYDAVTIGNHDLDNGVGGLAAAMKFATFDFVSANYDVSGTAIAARVKPYVVKVVGGIRVGIFGLGIDLVGLNAPDTYKGIKFLDPVETARSTVRILREREHCALVVCLSHLGYYEKPKEGQLGDAQLASQVDGIDFIASGHTHIFMEKPVVARQPSGKDTIIFQVGKSGIYLGRVDFTVRSGQVIASAGHLLDVKS